MPTLETTQDMARFSQYTALRDAPRQTMAHGVYPNSVKALAEYQTLVDWLAENPDYASLHSTTTSQVTDYIAQMQQAMSAIIQIMHGIESAALGTFGIALPEEQPG